MRAATAIRYMVIGGVIPANMSLSEGITVDAWVKGLKQEVVPLARGVIRSDPQPFAITLRSRYTLRFSTRKNTLWWLLYDRAEVIGAGYASRTDIGYASDVAAIFRKSLRGSRLYPLILRTIAASLHCTIESDTLFVGVSALKAWKRMGVYLPQRGRFSLQKRDNPMRRIIPGKAPFDADFLRRLLTRMATEPLRS